MSHRSEGVSFIFCFLLRMLQFFLWNSMSILPDTPFLFLYSPSNDLVAPVFSHCGYLSYVVRHFLLSMSSMSYRWLNLLKPWYSTTPIWNSPFYYLCFLDSCKLITFMMSRFLLSYTSAASLSLFFYRCHL